MKIAYNALLVPPAPFLSVRVSNPITQEVSAPMMANALRLFLDGPALALEVLE